MLLNRNTVLFQHAAAPLTLFMHMGLPIGPTLKKASDGSILHPLVSVTTYQVAGNHLSRRLG